MRSLSKLRTGQVEWKGPVAVVDDETTKNFSGGPLKNLGETATVIAIVG